MVYNPVGFVQVKDGGVPRTVSVTPIAAFSGGMMVYCSGAANVVSSGANSFVTTDILAVAQASGNQFNGILLDDATSGNVATIATRGMVIVTASNTVDGGLKVATDGSSSVLNAGSVAGNVAALRTIGRAFTPATSGNYCLVDLHG